MLKNYFKVAFRRLLKNSVFFTINISGLSLGLTWCILILIYSKDERSFDRFHSNGQHIYQLVCDRIEKDGMVTKSAIAAMVQGPAFQQAVPEMQSFTRVYHQPVVVKKDVEIFNEDICWADSNFFSVFSFPMVHGNNQSMVLTEELAKKYFGTTEIIGRSIRLEINGAFQPFVISGLAKKPPSNSSIQFGCVAPFTLLEKSNPDNGWMWFSFPTYFVLHPLAVIESVKIKMDQIYRLQAAAEITMNHDAGYDTQFRWGLLPLSDMHLNTQYQGVPGGSDPIYTYVLSGIALFILLIALINFINLSVAGSLKQLPEIAFRKMLGASRRQLIVQFMTESMLVSFIAFLLAIVAAQLLLPFFNELTNKKINLFHLVDGSLLMSWFLMYLFCFVGAGFYPAVIISGKRLFQKKRSNHLSKILVVGQFAVAILLIIAMLSMSAQLKYMTHAETGYNQKNLLEFVAEKAVMNQQMMENCKTGFMLVPGVEGVGYGNIGRFGGKTQAGGKEFAAVYEHIDENYLPVMQATILNGRNFSQTLKTDMTHAVLVNETFAAAAGWTDAAGKIIDYINIPGVGEEQMMVIGVVKDYHWESLKEKIKPQLFCMLPQLPLGRFIVRLNTTDPKATVKALERAFHVFFPEQPFHYNFREDALQKNYADEARWNMIITYAAVMAILIACLGLFGLATTHTENRRREIAIHKVLGAGFFQLLRIILKSFVRLILISMMLAFPIGRYVTNRWLEQFAYRIQPAWWMFGLAGFIAICTAMLTIGVQAVKAAVATPITALKNK